MLKIEVVKFEAQDIITSSVGGPNVVECSCNPLYRCIDVNGVHYYYVNGNQQVCNAPNHDS